MSAKQFGKGRFVTGSLIGWLLVALTGCGQEAGEPAAATKPEDKPAAVLRWTAIPDTDAELLKQKYDPISAYLEKALGVAVEYVPVADYKASVEAFKAGDVQLAWFGGLTGVQARVAVAGARAIAQGEEDPNYRSYFIAHQSTGIEKSDDFPVALADVPFSFGSQSSTSGRLMPEFFLMQETGKGPADFFTQGFSFSGAHDLTARLVADGTQIKAGVLNYKTYDKMVEKGEIDPEVARIVWVTPGYADYNFTAHPRLDEMFRAGFVGELQQALLAIDDRALLDAFPRKSLIAAKNEDFEGIADIARSLGLVR